MLNKMGKKPVDIILFCLTWGFAALTLIALLFIILHVLINGIPHLTPSLFERRFTTENVSMFPAIISTIMFVVLTLAMAVPLGIFTSIYLVEYVKKGSKMVTLIRSAAEMLAGIPSVVYGLFGMLLFVEFFGFGWSLIAGSLTLTVMILPVVIRTTEEALKSVSGGYREGGFALGAGKLRVVFRIVLPSAVPGILAGVILAIGRIVGETAALIFTAGTIPQVPQELTQSARTLAVHMWNLSGEAHHTNEAYATAVILLLIVLLINTASALVARLITAKKD
ncbi:MAG: phosphate ABC transporter permease PstA [Defluviitaleaceae bacterium]|nr:phosphate ABC transporter permease PstA [Defluviitaleaceae bacterium]